jgi:DNA invertase Pin-like site-specific DNA recombinase
MDHESAKTGKREAFQRLFTDASRRKFDVVLVWALDRFVGRNLHPNTESSKATLRGFG